MLQNVREALANERFVTPTLFRVINTAGGLILGFLGVTLLWDGVVSRIF